MNWHFSAFLYIDPVSSTREVTMAASLLPAVTPLPGTVYGVGSASFVDVKPMQLQNGPTHGYHHLEILNTF